MKRVYESIVSEHFAHNKQMAFLCGPRQVGKTTITKILQHHSAQSVYRTWDSPEDRVRLMAKSSSTAADL